MGGKHPNPLKLREIGLFGLVQKPKRKQNTKTKKQKREGPPKRNTKQRKG